MRDNSQITYPRGACLSSFWLRIIALVTMICDHVGYTGLSDLWWLRLVGRTAFPLYAFLLVEGFYHTHDIKKYALRLTVFALLAELPFNYMATLGRSFKNAEHQSVMVTLLLGLGLICALDLIQRRFIVASGGGTNARGDGGSNGVSYPQIALALALTAAAIAAVCLIADWLHTDYKSWGIMLIAAMWLFRGRLWLIAASEVALFVFIMPAYASYIPLFGGFNAPFYGFALLSLVFIALYNGKPGPKAKWLQYLFYAAYPLHMLLLGYLASR